ncbi:MAG: hypothetical protein L6R35_006136, partial [Caloplaca aegaea]
MACPPITPHSSNRASFTKPNPSIKNFVQPIQLKTCIFQTLFVTLALGAAALAIPVNLAPSGVLLDGVNQGLSGADFATSTIGATGQEVTDVLSSSTGLLGPAGEQASDLIHPVNLAPRRVTVDEIKKALNGLSVIDTIGLISVMEEKTTGAVSTDDLDSSTDVFGATGEQASDLAPRDVVDDALNAETDIIGSTADFTTDNLETAGQEATDILDSCTGIIAKTGGGINELIYP